MGDGCKAAGGRQGAKREDALQCFLKEVVGLEVDERLLRHTDGYICLADLDIVTYYAQDELQDKRFQGAYKLPAFYFDCNGWHAVHITHRPTQISGYASGEEPIPDLTLKALANLQKRLNDVESKGDHIHMHRIRTENREQTDD